MLTTNRAHQPYLEKAPTDLERFFRASSCSDSISATRDLNHSISVFLVFKERSQCVKSQNRGACARQTLKPAWRKSFTTIMGCGGIPIRPAHVPQPWQGSCERSGGCTTQEPCPPQSPRLFGPSPQYYGLTPRSGFCQKGQELPGLLRPPEANLPNLPRTTNGALPRGLASSERVLSFLRLASTKTAPMWAARGCAEPSQCKADSEQGQPVCQDLDSSAISEHGIRDHSAACLPADASPSALHCEPPPPQESCPRTQLGGGQDVRKGRGRRRRR